MTQSKYAIGIALAGCLTIYAPAADAQISTCVRVMLQLVGKPLAEAAAKKGSEMLVGYFADKLTTNRSGSRGKSSADALTERDLQNLRLIYQQNGRSECELRHDLERVVYAAPTYDPMPAKRPPSLCMTTAGTCTTLSASGSFCGCYNSIGQVYPGIAQ